MKKLKGDKEWILKQCIAQNRLNNNQKKKHECMFEISKNEMCSNAYYVSTNSSYTWWMAEFKLHFSI